MTCFTGSRDILELTPSLSDVDTSDMCSFPCNRVQVHQTFYCHSEVNLPFAEGRTNTIIQRCYKVDDVHFSCQATCKLQWNTLTICMEKYNIFS